MAMSVAGHDPVTAPEEERAALKRLIELIGADEGREVDLLGPEGEPVPMPSTALHLLREIAEILARGEGAIVASVGSEVTLSQAADLLAVSSSYLDRLLDDSVLPSTGLGAERRIPLTDLLAYKRAEDARRREAMTELVRLSEELGLYEKEMTEPIRRG